MGNVRTRPIVGWAWAGLLMALLAGCPASPAASHPRLASRTPSPSPLATPWLSPDAAFAAVSGTYRTAGGETWVVDLQGLLVDLHTGVARALTPDSTRDEFTIGPSMGEDSPAQGHVSFAVDGNGLATVLVATGVAVGAFTAGRVLYASREVRFKSGRVTLAGTLSEPLCGQGLPAIALIHGSGVQPRPLFSLWANFYNSMGFAVLNYDKRGTGDSGGTYPGELATAESLSTYADDAVAAARFLQRQPEIDPTRVGFHGGSQGGWVVPLALERAPNLAFAVLVSAPAVTTAQQGLYQDFSGGSSYVPSVSESEINAQVKRLQGGYDPSPALRALHVPTIWLFGDKDRQVPVGLSIQNLRGLHGQDLSIVALPGAWHGLTETPNGLETEAAASTSFAPGLFIGIGHWLEQQHLTTTPP